MHGMHDSMPNYVISNMNHIDLWELSVLCQHVVYIPGSNKYGGFPRTASSSGSQGAPMPKHPKVRFTPRGAPMSECLIRPHRLAKLTPPEDEGAGGEAPQSAITPRPRLGSACTDPCEDFHALRAAWARRCGPRDRRGPAPGPRGACPPRGGAARRVAARTRRRREQAAYAEMLPASARVRAWGCTAWVSSTA